MFTGAIRDEATGGFVDATRGMCELWSDSSAELLESAKSLKGELRCMLRTGRYEEGKAEAVAYAYGRDLGLAWARRRGDVPFHGVSAHPFPSHTQYGCSDDEDAVDTCDDCERSYGPHYGACRCGRD